jgi:transposase
MIDYQTFHQIRHLRDEEHLSAAQIAAALQLDERTVSKWINVEKYQPRKTGKRKRKLDAFKSTIVRLLAQHPFTAAQLLHRLKESGYTGGYSILKAFVQHVRPAPAPAFLTLHFAPGQSAQVDWGSAVTWILPGTTASRSRRVVLERPTKKAEWKKPFIM